MAGDVEVVLFDLGGVLVEFAGFGAMGELAGIDSHDEVLHRWITCPWVRSFERGECTPDDFAAGMVDEWGLPLTAPEFLDAFGSWLGDLLPGAADLVEETSGRVTTGVLSNCNSLHWRAHLARWPVMEG